MQGATALSRIIDCLEFARGLRILDPLDELCSLAADCERHGAAHVAGLIIESYCAVAGDGAAEPLLHFYRCFRACVRARIAIRHLRDEPATDAERWVRCALEYLDVAQRHAGNLG